MNSQPGLAMDGALKVTMKSCPTLCNPMDSSLHQAPPSMGFSRQEYWSGLPFPSPGNLPNPGIKPRSLTLQTDALPSEPPGKSNNDKRKPNSVKTVAEVQSKCLGKYERKCQSLSHVQLFVTPWAVACQTPLSVGFSRQEHWSVLPFLSTGDVFLTQADIISHVSNSFPHHSVLVGNAGINPSIRLSINSGGRSPLPCPTEQMLTPPIMASITIKYHIHTKCGMFPSLVIGLGNGCVGS